MPKINTKKLKSRTPINIKVPKAQADQLKAFPRASLNRFKSGTHTATDWYNLTFRIKVGLTLAESLYEQETVDGFTIAINVCKDVLDRFHATGSWSATTDELESIEAAIDAIDAMQDKTLRRDQLSAHLAADAYVKTLTKTMV